jgi:putative toxin-antitoxin system antitoxin component (TIGR02293 family)
MATVIEEVETLLGVPTKEAGAPLAVARSIEGGLSVAAVERVAKALAPDDAGFKFRIVPKSTLERRRKAKQRLTSDEGNKVARLAKVYSMAMGIYRDETKVRAFLMSPHMMLENETPIDVALATGPCADAVINLLGRAAFSGGV